MGLDPERGFGEDVRLLPYGAEEGQFKSGPGLFCFLVFPEHSIEGCLEYADLVEPQIVPAALFQVG